MQQVQAPDYRALLDALGHPPIMGGAPEDEEQPEQDTPSEGTAPENTEDTPAESQEDAVDYEKRYNDLRPEYDRTQQLVAAARGDHGEAAQAQALEALGLAFDEDEDDEPEDEDFEFADPDERIERLESHLAEREEADQQAQLQEMEDNFLLEGIEALEKREGRELSDEEFSALARMARAERLDNGVPDIEGAYESLEGLAKSRHQAWLESKKTSRKPSSGVTASRDVDLSTPEARIAAAAEAAEAASHE